MKKQMLLALWLPLIAITVFTGCKKQVQGLTQYKKFSYLIRVDGVNFIAEEISFWGSYDAIKAELINTTSGTQNLLFSASYISTSEVGFYIKNFTGKGAYIINDTIYPGNYLQSPPNGARCYYYQTIFTPGTSGSGALYYWGTTPIYNGVVNVINNDSTTLEANFEFTGYNPYNRTTKHITGYFLKKG